MGLPITVNCRSCKQQQFRINQPLKLIATSVNMVSLFIPNSLAMAECIKCPSNKHAEHGGLLILLELRRLPEGLEVELVHILQRLGLRL